LSTGGILPKRIPYSALFADDVTRPSHPREGGGHRF
jgi:hypothetical protein